LPDETVLLLMAASTSDVIRRQASAYLDTYRHIKPSMTGKDLKAMGFTPGPLFKKILDRLLQARLNGEVSSKTEERVLARHFVERHGKDERRRICRC